MGKLVAKPSNKLNIRIQKVNKAYFAKKEIIGTETVKETTPYSFKHNGNSTDTQEKKQRIAKAIFNNIKKSLEKSNKATDEKEIIKVLTKKVYNKGDSIDIPLVKPKITFTKLREARLNEEVYIVIETEHMPDREIKMNLRQGGDKKVLTDLGETIYVNQQGKNVWMFTATVGEFAKNNKDIANAQDFKDYAIAKITLGSTQEDTHKQYTDALEKAKDYKALVYLLTIAEPEGWLGWSEVWYNFPFDNRLNIWYYGEKHWFEVKANNVLNIYHTGEISKLDFEGLEKVIYVYHDKDGNEHNLGTFEIVEAQKWSDGTSHEWKTKQGGEWETITIGNKTRYYKKDSNKKTPLITPFSGSPKVFKYTDSKNIDFALYENTSREYFNPEAFATLIGALAEVNYKDVVSNGSVGSDGTGAYSVSHINGFNMDFKYLRTDKKKAKIDKDSTGNIIPVIYVNSTDLDIERQNSFLDALNKFGWGVNSKNLSNKTKENKNLNHCKADKHHKDHLHIQGLKINYKK